VHTLFWLSSHVWTLSTPFGRTLGPKPSLRGDRRTRVEEKLLKNFPSSHVFTATPGHEEVKANHGHQKG
jgi:hypothetical protein